MMHRASVADPDRAGISVPPIRLMKALPTSNIPNVEKDPDKFECWVPMFHTQRHKKTKARLSTQFIHFQRSKHPFDVSVLS